MIDIISLEEAVGQINGRLIIDVRSPQEYARGHIPGAHNVPLFSDQARALVGTVYHQEGKQAAVRKGLSLVDSTAIYGC